MTIYGNVNGILQQLYRRQSGLIKGNECLSILCTWYMCELVLSVTTMYVAVSPVIKLLPGSWRGPSHWCFSAVFCNIHHDPCRAYLSERYLVMSFCTDMFRFAVNTSGIPRLTKFYTPLHQSSQTLIQKIFSLISIRPAGLCNFLDAPELEAFLGPKDGSDERWRVVYRNYATLYFVFVVDGAESELGILDLIQVNVASVVMPTL
jgi:hypothetical protein